MVDLRGISISTVENIGGDIDGIYVYCTFMYLQKVVMGYFSYHKWYDWI
jgi:hypothetical protein